ncbi:MAG: hypothetical protein ACFCAD_13560 [Pleurocapsa sp.]
MAAKAAVRRKAQSKALLFAATNARDPSGLLDPYLAMAQAITTNTIYFMFNKVELLI